MSKNMDLKQIKGEFENNVGQEVKKILRNGIVNVEYEDEEFVAYKDINLKDGEACIKLSFKEVNGTNLSYISFPNLPMLGRYPMAAISGYKGRVVLNCTNLRKNVVFEF